MAPRKVILGLANHLKVGSGGGGGEGVKVAGGTKAGGRHDDDCYEETTAERHPQEWGCTNNRLLLAMANALLWIFASSGRLLFVSFATYSKRLRTSDIRRGLFALAPSASKAFFSEKLLNRGNQDHGLPGALAHWLINRTQKQTQTQ